MCRLRNIALESVTEKCVRRTDRRTDRQTDGQSYPYVSLCFAGDTTKLSKTKWTLEVLFNQKMSQMNASSVFILYWRSWSREQGQFCFWCHALITGGDTDSRRRCSFLKRDVILHPSRAEFIPINIMRGKYRRQSICTKAKIARPL